MNAANSVTMVGGETMSAADDTANTAAATSANADYTIGSGNVSIDTDSTLITIKSLDSTGTASIVTMVGTGGLTISGAVTATAALAILVNEEADNILSIGGVSGAVLSLGTGSVLNLTGAVTHGGTIIARDDGDGTVNISAATTQSGAIGATADDIGVVNISAASTIGAASFIRDLNITGDVLVDLTANMAIDTIDLTSTTSSVKIGALMVGATGSQTTVVTMNATGQKVILDGTADVAANITVATDGFGEVQIDTAAQTLGVIGTSTALKVGLVDIDAAATIENNVFADLTTIKTGQTMTIGGTVADIVYTGVVRGDTDASGGIGNLTINNGAAAADAITFSGDVGIAGEIDMLTLTTEANFSSDVKSDGITIANATTGKFAGNLTIGAADLTLGNATSIADFNGTTTQTLTGGAAAEEIDGTGVINISNTSTGGVVFSTHATIDSNTVQLKLAANARATTSVVSHVVKDITTLGGSVLVLDDTIATTNTIFTTTDALTEDSVHASSLIKMPSNFDSGETIKLFVDVLDADVVAITADVNSALVDTGLVNYVATTTDTDDITVTATETTDAGAASTLVVNTNSAISLRQARAAMLASASGIDSLTNILSLENGITVADRKKFTEQSAFQEDTIIGSSLATRAMTGTVQGIVSNRMASLRSGDAFVTGMSAGNGMSANSGFIQAFGSEAEQKNTSIWSYSFWL